MEIIVMREESFLTEDFQTSDTSPTLFLADAILFCSCIA